MRFVALLSLTLSATAWADVGWRGDGTGIYPKSVLPSAWSATDHVRWTVPLKGRSNASPVAAAGKVCVLEEPSGLVCVDASTGAVSWRASLDVLDVLPAAEAAPLRPRVAAAPKLQSELRAMQAEYALLRRAARGGGDALTQIEAVVAKMAEVSAELKAISAYLPPVSNDEIGWTSPTPITDGKRIWVFLANGVVACFSMDGKRQWAHWLGPHTGRLIGYEGRPTASPVLVSGVLAVAHDALVGFDAATGAKRWEVGPYEDFGAPAATVVGGIGVILTPSGRLVRASDGLVMQQNLAAMLYSGPVAIGSRVWFVGNTTDMLNGKWPSHARSYDLVVDGDKVKATERWNVQLASRERIYASALVWGNRLISVAIDGTMMELDATTGASVRTVPMAVPEQAQIWASPMVVGSSVRLFTDRGNLLTLGADLTLQSASRVEAGLGQPHFDAAAAYIRGDTKLWAVAP